MNIFFGIDEIVSFGFILLIVFGLAFIVFCHEMGHYLAARSCGVFVQEFSIGMGKSLFKFMDKRLTTWKVSVLPIGGYVEMYQNKSDIPKEKHPDITKIKTIKDCNLFQQVWIILAGPIFSYICGILMLFGCFAISGYDSEPVVLKNLKSYNGKILKKGDRITKVGDSKVKFFSDIGYALNSNEKDFMQKGKKRKVKIDLIRQNKKLKLNGVAVKENGRFVLGITSDQSKKVKIGPLDALRLSFLAPIKITKMSFLNIKKMVVSPRKANTGELVGPIGIFRHLMLSAKSGASVLIVGIAYISISLGFFNLLPIMPLDGGRILVAVLSSIISKKNSIKISSIFNIIGIILFVFLMLYTSLKDITKALILKPKTFGINKALK